MAQSILPHWPRSRLIEQIFRGILRARMKHRFECRYQCHFNSDIKNSKLCNILTYKGFIPTQRWIHPVPADAVWIKQQHVYVLILHSHGNFITSLICFLCFFMDFCSFFVLWIWFLLFGLVWNKIAYPRKWFGKLRASHTVKFNLAYYFLC